MWSVTTNILAISAIGYLVAGQHTITPLSDHKPGNLNSGSHFHDDNSTTNISTNYNDSKEIRMEDTEKEKSVIMHFIDGDVTTIVPGTPYDTTPNYNFDTSTNLENTTEPTPIKSKNLNTSTIDKQTEIPYTNTTHGKITKRSSDLGDHRSSDESSKSAKFLIHLEPENTFDNTEDSFDNTPLMLNSDLVDKQFKSLSRNPKKLNSKNIQPEEEQTFKNCSVLKNKEMAELLNLKNKLMNRIKEYKLGQKELDSERSANTKLKAIINVLNKINHRYLKTESRKRRDIHRTSRKKTGERNQNSQIISRPKNAVSQSDSNLQKKQNKIGLEKYINGSYSPKGSVRTETKKLRKKSLGKVIPTRVVKSIKRFRQKRQTDYQQSYLPQSYLPQSYLPQSYLPQSHSLPNRPNFLENIKPTIYYFEPNQQTNVKNLGSANIDPTSSYVPPNVPDGLQLSENVKPIEEHVDLDEDKLIRITGKRQNVSLITKGTTQVFFNDELLPSRKKRSLRRTLPILNGRNSAPDLDHSDLPGSRNKRSSVNGISVYNTGNPIYEDSLQSELFASLMKSYFGNIFSISNRHNPTSGHNFPFELLPPRNKYSSGNRFSISSNGPKPVLEESVESELNNFMIRPPKDPLDETKYSDEPDEKKDEDLVVMVNDFDANRPIAEDGWKQVYFILHD